MTGILKTGDPTGWVRNYDRFGSQEDRFGSQERRFGLGFRKDLRTKLLKLLGTGETFLPDFGKETLLFADQIDERFVWVRTWKIQKLC